MKSTSSTMKIFRVRQVRKRAGHIPNRFRQRLMSSWSITKLLMKNFTCRIRNSCFLCRGRGRKEAARTSLTSALEFAKRTLLRLKDRLHVTIRALHISIMSTIQVSLHSCSLPGGTREVQILIWLLIFQIKVVPILFHLPKKNVGCAAFEGHINSVRTFWACRSLSRKLERVFLHPKIRYHEDKTGLVFSLFDLSAEIILEVNSAETCNLTIAKTHQSMQVQFSLCQDHRATCLKCMEECMLEEVIF